VQDPGRAMQDENLRFDEQNHFLYLLFGLPQKMRFARTDQGYYFYEISILLM
jgi:hypothetical protein